MLNDSVRVVRISAARYFNNLGFKVAGYDKSASDLTSKLEAEGCQIHYEDLGEEIPNEFKNKATTFVVFTPAIPEDMKELFYFISNEFVFGFKKNSRCKKASERDLLFRTSFFSL